MGGCAKSEAVNSKRKSDEGREGEGKSAIERQVCIEVRAENTAEACSTEAEGRDVDPSQGAEGNEAKSQGRQAGCKGRQIEVPGAGARHSQEIAICLVRGDDGRMGDLSLA